MNDQNNKTAETVKSCLLGLLGFIMVAGGAYCVFFGVSAIIEMMPVFSQQGDGWVGLGKLIAGVFMLLLFVGIIIGAALFFGGISVLKKLFAN